MSLTMNVFHVSVLLFFNRYRRSCDKYVAQNDTYVIAQPSVTLWCRLNVTGVDTHSTSLVSRSWTEEMFFFGPFGEMLSSKLILIDRNSTFFHSGD